jgi:HSP20 family protein
MATVVRWEPFRELAAVQSELSQLLNGLVQGNGGNGRSAASTWVPAVDVWETEAELVYAFDLPGIPEDKISVELEDGALTVSAAREKKASASGERFYRFERRYGTFSRTIGVPQGVKEDDVVASYADGVLEIHVPKPEQPKPRRIQVVTGANGAQPTIEGSAEQR